MCGVITRARTGTPDFPPPTGGGGGVFEYPRLFRLLLVVEKKKRSKARQKLIRDYFSQFLAKVKIVVPRTKNGQIFRVFSRLSNIVSENLHYLGNCYS